jgi:hypothetical protein
MLSIRGKSKNQYYVVLQKSNRMNERPLLRTNKPDHTFVSYLAGPFNVLTSIAPESSKFTLTYVPKTFGEALGTAC